MINWKKSTTEDGFEFEKKFLHENKDNEDVYLFCSVGPDKNMWAFRFILQTRWRSGIERTEYRTLAERLSEHYYPDALTAKEEAEKSIINFLDVFRL